MNRNQVLEELDRTGRKITDNDKDICARRLHYCLDWDGMPIDSESLEFESCLCYE